MDESAERYSEPAVNSSANKNITSPTRSWHGACLPAPVQRPSARFVHANSFPTLIPKPKTLASLLLPCNGSNAKVKLSASDQRRTVPLPLHRQVLSSFAYESSLHCMRSACCGLGRSSCPSCANLQSTPNATAISDRDSFAGRAQLLIRSNQSAVTELTQQMERQHTVGAVLPQTDPAPSPPGKQYLPKPTARHSRRPTEAAAP